MHTICHNNVIYIYRNEQLMIDSFVSRGSMCYMYSADYAVQLDPSSEYDYCAVIKDRSGVFSKSSSLPFKKVMKMIKILMEENI